MRRIVLLICAAILFAAQLQAQQATPFKIVVNASNGLGSLTKAQVSNLFLKKVTRWDNGHKILPVDQLENSTTRDAFTKKVFGRSVAAIKSYWQQKIFSGSDVPPPELSTDNEVLSYIQMNIDAIGYVSSNTQTNSKVKVIELKE